MNELISLSNQKENKEGIFLDMEKITQGIAVEGAKKMQTGFQVTLLIQYDLGTIINELFNAEDIDEAQRKREIKKLAAYWNLSNLNIIYDLVNVSTAFTREFIKAQVEEQMTNGNFLSWNHFKELQKIGSEKRQLTLLKQIRRNCWSANELSLELQGNREAEVKRTGGRKPKLPKTPVAMLQKIYASVQQTDNYLEAMSEPLAGMFLEIAPNDVTEQFVWNIENTLTRITKARNQLSNTFDELSTVLTRSKEVLSKQAKPAVTASAAKKAVTVTQVVTPPPAAALPTARKQLKNRSSR